jgi:hypothetical protein
MSDQDTGIILKNSVSPPTQSAKPEELLVSENEIMISTNHIRHQDPGRVASSVESCVQTCRCQCHPRTTIESSRWLTDVLGTLFYSYVETPFPVARPCTAVECIQPPGSSYQLTYHFPQWVSNRAFTLTMAYGSLGALSGSCSISFPRAIPVYHKAWLHIQRHELAELRKLLSQRVVYVNDLSDDDGTPLLTVGYKESSLSCIC